MIIIGKIPILNILLFTKYYNNGLQKKKKLQKFQNSQELWTIPPKKRRSIKKVLHSLKRRYPPLKMISQMKCIQPLTIWNKKRKEHLSVPCGKCLYCLEEKRADWSFRIKEELRTAVNAWFVTMTYDEDHIEIYDCITGESFHPDDKLPEGTSNLVSSLSKRDAQLFIKRLRKEVHQRYKQYARDKNVALESFKYAPVRYFLSGEYGEQTDRPHYHAIIFNVPRSVAERTQIIWGKGHVKVVPANDATIHYVTKYVINKDRELVGRIPMFSLMSRRPGLGHKYLERAGKMHNREKQFSVKQSGFKQNMPRFYKDKVFSSIERESNRVQGEQNSYKQFWEEYDRLKKLGHKDPVSYMNSQERNNYELKVKRVKNKKSKL